MQKWLEIITFRKVMWFAIAAGLINTLPWFFLQPGADAFFRYGLIDCFDWQFWHGDLKPSWCMHADGGLGSPAFMFYFPLTHYMTAMMYPLRAILNLTTDDVYMWSMVLGGIAGFITCWMWLADSFDRRIALVGAFLFLWMPYRSELLFYRSAQTELWEVVFLPLLFLTIRRALRDPKPNWPNVSFVIILSLLSQIPAALVALVCAGIYVLIMAGKQYRHWVGFGFAVLLAFAALAIYIAPAHYFLQFLDPARLAKSKATWVVRDIRLEDVYLRTGAFAAFCVMSIFCGMLSWLAWKNRDKVEDDFKRREVLAWIVIGLASFILVLPTGEPIWYIFDLVVGPVIAPWRIQALIMMAAVYLFCARATWFLSEKRRKTFNGDTVVLFVLMMLVGASMITVRTDDREAQGQLRSLDWTVGIEYKSRWTDEDHASYEYMLKQAEIGKERTIAKILGKGGSISNPQITVDSIMFNVMLKNDMDVLVKHWYFPIWYATVDGADVEIKPQNKSGQMVIHVPKGKHDIVLTRSISRTIPKLYLYSELISAAALLILLIWRMRLRYRVVVS